MVLIAVLALFGNGFQFQKSFDVCLDNNFKNKECKVHFDRIKNNPKSKHYHLIND